MTRLLSDQKDPGALQIFSTSPKRKRVNLFCFYKPEAQASESLLLSYIPKAQSGEFLLPF